VALAGDVRYVGQAFEILTPWRAIPDEGELAAADIERLLADFHALHRQRFSYANPAAAVEIVTLRLTATGIVPKPETAHRPSPASRGAARHRPVYLHGAWRDLRVLDREGLSVGAAIAGPAIVEEGYTTLLIQEGWTATADRSGNLIAESTTGDLA
jgi:N-methylhydantoinase A